MEELESNSSYYEKDDYGTKRVCPFCLRKKTLVYGENEFKHTPHQEIDEILNDTFCIHLVVNIDQHLICNMCLTKVKEASHFKKQIIENQKEFQHHFSKLNDIDWYSPDNGEVKQEIEQNIGRDNFVCVTNKHSHDERNISVFKIASNDLYKVSKLNDTDRKKKSDTVTLLKNSNLCPFRWQRNKYKCFCCTETFIDVKSIKLHMATHSFEEIEKKIAGNSVYHKVEVSSLKCHICGKEIKQYAKFKTHLKSEHSIVFNSKEDLLIPFKLEDSMQCVLCSKTFLVFHTLNVHMNQHYRNHICETCGQAFMNKISMKKHIHCHVKRNYKCKKCDLTFASVHQKESHSIATHKNMEKRVCPHCPERFSGHYNKLLHMIDKHGYKKPEYKCSSCDKVFLRQFLVNSHIRKFHMREKNYECNICGLKFFGKSDITRHTTSHTGEKKYTCSYCGKSYTRKRSLEDHLKTHNGLRPPSPPEACPRRSGR